MGCSFPVSIYGYWIGIGRSFNSISVPHGSETKARAAPVMPVRIAKGKFQDFTRQHGGEPISLEDLLATLMAFSALVMDGFDTLKITLSADHRLVDGAVAAQFLNAVRRRIPALCSDTVVALSAFDQPALLLEKRAGEDADVVFFFGGDR
jgi:hypothetical protein